ncbi:MAG: transposase [Actinomycetota bacterium]|nr:transposase [Actinomycetota bacterium]
MHDRLARAGIESKCKTQQPVAKGGLFTKDRFDVDLQRDTARCRAGHTAPIRRASNGAGAASFWPHRTHCPLRQQCTTAPDGRTISVGIHERQLADARARQRDPNWIADYRATRPKVERKIAHLMRRHHGGRQARVRGTTKLAADFALLAAAVNLTRLAVLHAASVPGSGWATPPDEPHRTLKALHSSRNQSPQHASSPARHHDLRAVLTRADGPPASQTTRSTTLRNQAPSDSRSTPAT